MSLTFPGKFCEHRYASHCSKSRLWGWCYLSKHKLIKTVSPFLFFLQGDSCNLRAAAENVWSILSLIIPKIIIRPHLSTYSLWCSHFHLKFTALVAGTNAVNFSLTVEFMHCETDWAQVSVLLYFWQRQKCKFLTWEKWAEMAVSDAWKYNLVHRLQSAETSDSCFFMFPIKLSWVEASQVPQPTCPWKWVGVPLHL